MASFQFIDRATDLPVNLDQVDAIICEREGIELDEELTSQAYQFLVEFGFTVLLRHGGFEVGDKDEHRVWIETECFSEDHHRSKDLALWAFFEKFKFQAWR